MQADKHIQLDCICLLYIQRCVCVHQRIDVSAILGDKLSASLFVSARGDIGLANVLLENLFQ
jgi:hypothetical protein